MRLINTSTLQFGEFFGSNIPRYAILSHTWGDGEMSYQDWLYCQRQVPRRWGWVYHDDEVAKLQSTSGHAKIVNACRTSSAALSDAINSMFDWYGASSICYAFLADVPTVTPHESTPDSSDFKQSWWFTRGRTLQELIAPHEVHFYSESWNFIASTSSNTLPLLFKILRRCLIPYSTHLLKKSRKSSDKCP
ncbi:hypothetical protein B0H63DRAFT_447609 [Podospora didyma]|uniref:Heterokaryon incompatibility domain-containing protein n=1 Tax=Podospora didyma TaxID=330526 RepID=A0AAE0U0Q8_9PEZI|nr:hypothetical protein B0H63DRAFT_447609 [Podospora didyma]